MSACFIIICVLVIITPTRSIDDPPPCHSLTETITCFQMIRNTAPFSNDSAALVLHFNGYYNITLFKGIFSQILDSRVSVNIMGIRSDGYETDLCKGYIRGTDITVHGTCEMDVFRGIVRSQELVYIEPASDYFKGENRSMYVLYRSDDVEFNVRWESPVSVLPIAHQLSRGGRNNRKIKDFPQHKSCRLHLVADHTYHEHIGGGNTARTIAEMVYHTIEADAEFRDSDFNQDGTPDEIGFSVAVVTVFTQSDYLFADTSLDIMSLLSKFSKFDFSDVCLGMLFTYRDFEKGTLGLAWKASTRMRNSVGGICQRRVFMSMSSAPLPTVYSYNTLLVTQLNHGYRLPRDVVTGVVIHELGHSFGASHDPIEGPCFPHDTSHYVMHPYSGAMNHKNHLEFSSCSLRSIAETLLVRSFCFQDTFELERCGNLVKDNDEDCDCGGTERACQLTDQCCGPNCKIKRNKGFECSPQQSPCCSETCQIVIASTRKVCLPETDCTFASHCDGMNSSCPMVTNKPNKTLCQHRKGYCVNGVCSISMCDQYGLETCQCVGERRNMCKLCCGCLNENPESCVPANELDIQRPGGRPFYLDAGKPCNRSEGYCNAQGECLAPDLWSMRGGGQHIWMPSANSGATSTSITAFFVISVHCFLPFVSC